MNTQIQLTEAKPIYQEVEQALINIVKAGIYYKKPKEGKFMQNYKEWIIKLCQTKDPNKYIKNLVQTIFSNEQKYKQIMNNYKLWYRKDPKILNSIIELYKLYYKLAKDNFIKETQVDEEAEDFFNL